MSEAFSGDRENTKLLYAAARARIDQVQARLDEYDSRGMTWTEAAEIQRDLDSIDEEFFEDG